MGQKKIKTNLKSYEDHLNLNINPMIIGVQNTLTVPEGVKCPSRRPPTTGS